MHSQKDNRRTLALAVAVPLAILVLVGCGHSSDANQASPPKTKVPGTFSSPRVHVPPGLPPRKLVVRNLKLGTGAVAKWGQYLRVHHIGVNYKTKKTFEVQWGRNRSFGFNFGTGEVRKGWDIGLKGMKVGGQRELILPSRLAYGTGALVYIVELIAIE